MRTPREFQGPQVAESYPCLTFRRTVAIQYPARDVEFVTRLHPLFQAMAQDAHRQLTSPRDPNSSSARLAVRRHPFADEGPYAVFTCLCKDDHEHGQFLAVAIDAFGKTLPPDQVIAALDTNLPPGEVAWAEVEKIFAGRFEQLQAAAGDAAMKLLEEKAATDTRARQEFATVLREDAERYRADRLVEIDLEEKQAQAVEEQQSQQLLLDRREVYGFKAKRASVDTRSRPTPRRGLVVAKVSTSLPATRSDNFSLAMSWPSGVLSLKRRPPRGGMFSRSGVGGRPSS